MLSSTGFVWAEGGAFLRPNIEPPPKPGFREQGPPEGFKLPTVTEDEAPVLSQTKNLFIRQIVFEGGTVFSRDELNVLTATHEGRSNSIAELEDLRQQITKRYIARGYINSGAVIPKNGLVDGVLKFKLVEGKLTEIRVHGQERLREAYIAERLMGDPDEALNTEELQDRFQRLLSDPLISRMNARLLPGGSSGQSVLDLDVVRARPYHLSLFGNNYRPPTIGGEAFGLTGWVSNLSSFGETIDFTYTTSYASALYAGGISIPLTHWGTEAFVRFSEGNSYVYSAPLDQTLVPRSLIHSLEGGITHPLINRSDQRLNIGVSLSVRGNETFTGDTSFDFTGNPNLSDGRSQATVWRFFQEYIQGFDRHAFSFRSNFNVGMNALGATKEKNKNYPDGEYFSWLGQTYYTFQVMDNGAQLVIKGSLQVSNEPLLPLEQIAVGGVDSVRGYRENTLVRDEGYNFSMEFQYLLFGESINAPNKLVLIPFVDYGRAWNHGDNRNGNFSNRPYEEIYSAGIGVNWALKPFSADFYWGHAFKPTPNRNYGDLQDDGIHFQLQLDVL